MQCEKEYKKLTKTLVQPISRMRRVDRFISLIRPFKTSMIAEEEV